LSAMGGLAGRERELWWVVKPQIDGADLQALRVLSRGSEGGGRRRPY
jgi:hypothetical protein